MYWGNIALLLAPNCGGGVGVSVYVIVGCIGVGCVVGGVDFYVIVGYMGVWCVVWVMVCGRFEVSGYEVWSVKCGVWVFT